MVRPLRGGWSFHYAVGSPSTHRQSAVHSSLPGWWSVHYTRWVVRSLRDGWFVHYALGGLSITQWVVLPLTVSPPSTHPKRSMVCPRRAWWSVDHAVGGPSTHRNSAGRSSARTARVRSAARTSCVARTRTAPCPARPVRRPGMAALATAPPCPPPPPPPPRPRASRRRRRGAVRPGRAATAAGAGRPAGRPPGRPPGRSPGRLPGRPPGQTPAGAAGETCDRGRRHGTAAVTRTCNVQGPLS